MKIFKVTEDSNLSDFTDAVYPQGSFCLAALLRAKDVKINGARVNKNAAVKRGDEVIYYTTLKQEQKPSHSVVYEDENVLVADKHSGVSSEGLLSELRGNGEYYAVHRLDRNTQGLIVFAKTAAAEKTLLSAFKERRMCKVYHALCKNAFAEKSGTLTAYLLKNADDSEVRVFSSPRDGAAKIVTEYFVEREHGDLALVSIILHTGKTHQIRAHTAFIGCPVIGDEKYGDRALNAKYAAKRQRLVAKRITFGAGGVLSYLDGAVFESGFGLELPLV